MLGECGGLSLLWFLCIRMCELLGDYSVFHRMDELLLLGWVLYFICRSMFQSVEDGLHSLGGFVGGMRSECIEIFCSFSSSVDRFRSLEVSGHHERCESPLRGGCLLFRGALTRVLLYQSVEDL